MRESSFFLLSLPGLLPKPLNTNSQISFISFYSIDKKGKFSRKRLNEDEGDITYINERNRVFNKKVRLFLSHHPRSMTRYVLHADILLVYRSRGIMINIPQRSGRASSAGRRFDVVGTLVDVVGGRLLYYRTDRCTIHVSITATSSSWYMCRRSLSSIFISEVRLRRGMREIE